MLCPQEKDSQKLFDAFTEMYLNYIDTFDVGCSSPDEVQKIYGLPEEGVPVLNDSPLLLRTFNGKMVNVQTYCFLPQKGM